MNSIFLSQNSWNNTSAKHVWTRFVACFLVAFACSVHSQESLFAQANASTSATKSYPREEYAVVPVDIGFVTPLSVSGIVRGASGGKRILSHVSLHALGNVGNALEGVEFSGIWNTQTDYMMGVQGAGIINIVNGNAGFAQGAGVANIVGGVFAGAQGAGVFNIAAGGLRGAQGAGVFNSAGDGEMVQGAGVFNNAGNMKGVQAAGVFNTAKDVEGVQVAGVFNSARHVRGAQIGLINFAEDNEDVMIGLLNFSSKHGIRLELYTDEMRFIRAGLRTGNKAWYTTLTGGLQPFTGITIWSLGYGAGAQLYLGQKDFIDIGLHTETMFNGVFTRDFAVYAQALRLRTMFGHDFAPHFSVFIGPTLNVMAGVDNQVYELATNLFPGSGFIATSNNINFFGSNNAWLRSWVGITGGFRF